MELGDIGPAGLASLILLGVNLLLRRTPWVKNWAIPWISVALGMILFPMWLPLATQFQNPLGRNIGLGFLVGLAASIGYRKVVKLAANRWPWLDDIINNNDDEEKNDNEKSEKSNGTGVGAPPVDPGNRNSGG